MTDDLIEKPAAKKRLTHEDMLHLHAIIAGEVMDQGEAGRYRIIRLRVGAYVLPSPDRVARFIPSGQAWSDSSTACRGW